MSAQLLKLEDYNCCPIIVAVDQIVSVHIKEGSMKTEVVLRNGIIHHVIESMSEVQAQLGSAVKTVEPEKQQESGVPLGTRLALERMLQGMSPTDPQLIRPNIRAALDEYARDHVRRGDFLWAVLSNDLSSAVARADLENLVTLPAIVSYVYNELPGPCWGSQEKYTAWVRRGIPSAEERGEGITKETRR